MSETHISGPLATGNVAQARVQSALVAGVKAIDCATLTPPASGNALGAVVTRHGAGGGAAIEVALSGTTITLADGSGASTSAFTALVFYPIA